MTTSDKIKFREDLKLRLRTFVLQLLKMTQNMPTTQESKVIKGQLIRSGSSVYANYRAACRARSKNEFFSKLSIVVEEADETEMWLELLILSQIYNHELTQKLHSESIEILKIMATARKNSKSDIQ